MPLAETQVATTGHKHAPHRKGGSGKYCGEALWSRGRKKTRGCEAADEHSAFDCDMVTLETVMAFLKSLPPDILKPQGDGPSRFTVSAIM